MSPFFRGSVRPTKKHPKPWSLNPRLNPDLAKDGPRMSILGLPSTETDVILPVFNSVYGRSSLKEPVAISLNGARDFHTHKAIPEEVDDLPQQSTEAAISETAGVAGRDLSRVDAPAAETPQPVTTTAAETTETVDEPPSAPQPVEEDSPEETIKPAPAEPAPLSQDLSASDDRPLPAAASSSPIVDSTPEESAEPIEVRHQPDKGDAGRESAGAEGKRELFAGSLPAETLPAIDEEAPAAVAAAEEEEPIAVPEAVDPGVSGLESIEEVPEAETPAAAAAADPFGAAKASVGEESSEGVVEKPAVSQLPAAATDEISEVAPEVDAPEPLAPDEEAAEAPVVPRQSVLAAPVAATDEGEAPVTSGTRSSFTGSVSGSVATNEEPLVTDEQLEVSDEFKPGVKMYQMESSQRA